jgi:parallel beta-helix repeat protein
MFICGVRRRHHRNVIIRGHGEELPLVVVRSRRGLHFMLSSRAPGVKAASLRDICLVAEGPMAGGAITIDGSGDMIIEGCDISSKNGCGIYVTGRAYPVVTRTQIRDCHTHGGFVLFISTRC